MSYKACNLVISFGFKEALHKVGCLPVTPSTDALEGALVTVSRRHRRLGEIPSPIVRVPIDEERLWAVDVQPPVIRVPRWILWEQKGDQGSDRFSGIGGLAGEHSIQLVDYGMREFLCSPSEWIAQPISE